MSPRDMAPRAVPATHISDWMPTRQGRVEPAVRRSSSSTVPRKPSSCSLRTTGSPSATSSTSSQPVEPRGMGEPGSVPSSCRCTTGTPADRAASSARRHRESQLRCVRHGVRALDQPTLHVHDDERVRGDQASVAGMR